jgi:ERCC4-type nuclease
VAHVTTLEFGDAAFMGVGPGAGQESHSVPVWIGVERKRIRDLLQCLKDGRFTGHQLPGMLARFQFCYLLVEGETACDESGRLLVVEHGRWGPVKLGYGFWTYAAFEHHLLTIAHKTPLVVVRSKSARDTAAWLVAAYTWWQNTGWDGHQSHKQHHEPPAAFMEFSAAPKYRRAVMRIAQALPGISGKRAIAVYARFKTVQEMVNATPAEWEEIDGIGRGLAMSICATVAGPLDGATQDAVTGSDSPGKPETKSKRVSKGKKVGI